MPSVPNSTERVDVDAARRVASALVDRINRAQTATELNAIAGDAARARQAGAELDLVQLRFYQRCRELYPSQVR